MSLNSRWMQRAIELARRGTGFVHPNPLVGCVVVRGNRVVGEGYHHAFGKDHAEVEALRQAGSKAEGATLYVNLEPCSHWGKTPPCVIAIVASGVKHVVAAMRDPNPLVSGKGFAFLKKHGIRVTAGVLEKEAQELNRAFVTWVRHGRPYVTLKAAVSLDGRMKTVTGDSQWITGPQARRAGWKLRVEADAIAVGAGTILKDNPSLTAHGIGRNPIRIVFVGKRRLSKRAQVFNSAAKTLTIQGARNPVQLRQALADLARQGIAHLLVEGGPTLQESFLEAGVVDEVVWFIAPKLIGRAAKLSKVTALHNVQVSQLGPDLCVRGTL